MKTKRIISLVLCFVLSFSCVAFAENETEADITDKYESAADTLYMCGLFSGGTNGFDLTSESTKTEAAVMVVRLFGDESEATSKAYTHPFTDVQPWASSYIGYLYQKGINLSKSDTVLGARDNITCIEFVALLLQALGYDDIDMFSERDEVVAKALAVGLVTETEVAQIAETEFDRGTMVYLSLNALGTRLCNSTQTLYENLKAAGALKSLPAPTDEIKYGKSAVAPIDTQALVAGNIIAQAKANLGIRYRSGGKSPSTGFDCSGFVGYTMIQSGVWSQFYGSCDGVASQCTQVSMADAKPGDIVFFTGTYSTSHKYTHVGIYLGNGQMIHSASSSGVSISSITSGYWASHYSCIARPNVLM
jgi:cell wall-associated NlpC family hydrolase